MAMAITYQYSIFISLFLNFICLFMNVAIKTGSSPRAPPKSKLTVFDSPITPTLNIVSNLMLYLVFCFLWAIEKLNHTLHHQCLFISARGGHLHFLLHWKLTLLCPRIHEINWEQGCSLANWTGFCQHKYCHKYPSFTILSKNNNMI